MICIIALIVFGILGIFSYEYRLIAKEALNCVFKKVTLRKCDTGLDKRLKAQITGHFLRFLPSLGRMVYKYFEVFSWIFLILMVLSTYYTGLGVYNYAVYGNCNGKDSNAFCIFDPLGTSHPKNQTTEQCSIDHNAVNKELIVPQIGDSPRIGVTDAKLTVIEFGCYECHYTKAAEPVVEKMLEDYGSRILFVYKDFPLGKGHIEAFKSSEASFCALDQDKYWEYRKYLFANQPKLSFEDLVGYANEVGMDQERFASCLKDGKYKNRVEKSYEEGLASGVKATPTFFIGNKSIVGAGDYTEFEDAIEEKLGIGFWEKMKFWSR